MAVTVGVTMTALFLARTAGSGAPYGGVAIFVLPAYFLVVGVLLARAVLGALHRAPRILAWTCATASGAAATVGTIWTFDATGSDQALLPPLFACAVAASVMWAGAARPDQRPGARVTAVVAASLLVLALLVDRPSDPAGALGGPPPIGTG